MTEHVVTLERIGSAVGSPGRSSVRFRGVCSCGEKGPWVPTAGMVSGGWESRHLGTLGSGPALGSPGPQPSTA